MISVLKEKKDLGVNLGFTSLENEYSLDNLDVEGYIPSWLNGSFIRSSVSKFEFKNGNYKHWFDGIAMFHKFNINNGNVGYKNTFLQSSEYLKGIKSGKIEYSSFSTSPNKNILEKLKSLLIHDNYIPNANVNITNINGDLVAMTEIPGYVKFSPDTLQTLGVLQHNDQLKGQVTTAHPHYDFKRNETYNLMTNFSKVSNYIFYKIKSDSLKREVIASITVNNPSYNHFFAMTDNYLILVECPLIVNPLSIMISGKPFIENYKWKADKGTNFYVVEKDTGKVKNIFNTDSFFTFHGVNAYEDNDELILDIPIYKDSQIINDFYLATIKNNNSISRSELRRYKLNIEPGHISWDKIYDKSVELPRINYKVNNGKYYTDFYANSKSESSIFFDQIVKVNVKTGQDFVWSEKGCYPNEPIFIENKQTKDNGVVVSIVLDTNKGNSFFLILDSTNLSEMARIRVPHHIPFGFHGQFFPNIK